ncbi:hypothetical protein [Streptomyces sp. MJP52]|uniref:hypothetical protein n=1 Tax=Streptomyces sp. MJP52 TaxID=2940555 RepID=UPI00247685B5|nr:hypothetical protein [Streptomyces sp. MJP52]MDH6228535.1 hypothetical protein [Streptomyces sp. MJP52]
MRGRRCGGAAVRAAAVSLALAGLGACGVVEERRNAAGAEAVRFEAARDAGRHALLCAALAPGTRDELEETARSGCPEAIRQAVEEDDLPPAGAVRAVDVWGDRARVVLEGDTLFLSRFPGGWKVTAAGCEPRPDQPYRCGVKGG